MTSVCMATYNGEKYIKEQIESILVQLENDDELIISDDSSTDNTLSIISSFADSRIIIYKNCFHSPILNFEFCIKKAKGDVIITSDQDDIWLPGRVKRALDFHTIHNVQLVICKAQVIDDKGNIKRESFFYDKDPVRHSLFYNLWRNPYLGCCLSMTKDVVNKALPFPKGIAMHDIWLGLVAQAFFKVGYLNDNAYVQYRRYDMNYTCLHKYPIYKKISYRMKFLFELGKRYLF